MWHDQAQKRAARFHSRPWWVCCYGYNAVLGRHSNWGWSMEDNPWHDGKRRWQLLSIKTFQTLYDAFSSASYQRHYRPFSHPAALVVLRSRTTNDIGHITQFWLGVSL